jgi:hypothetical protein
MDMTVRNRILKVFQLSVTGGKLNDKKVQQFSRDTILFSGVKVDIRLQGYTVSELRSHNLEISTVETLKYKKKIQLFPY